MLLLKKKMSAHLKICYNKNMVMTCWKQSHKNKLISLLQFHPHLEKKYHNLWSILSWDTKQLLLKLVFRPFQLNVTTFWKVDLHRLDYGWFTVGNQLFYSIVIGWSQVWIQEISKEFKYVRSPPANTLL